MNTSSQTDIYNMALAAIGVSRFVIAPDDGSNEANMMNVFWNSVRDQCLQDFPWGFAMRYVELALISKTIQGWSYCYQYPSDCLQARLIMPTLSDVDVNPRIYDHYFRHRIPFAIVENEAGGGLAIATSIETPTLAYTARIKTIALWSPAFVNALSWLLGSKVAAPLSASPEYAISAGQAYEAALLKAGALSLNEGREKPEPECDLLLARR